LKSDEIVLKLDFRFNVNQNAERYYESSKQSREKSEGAKTAKGTTLEALKRIEDDIVKTQEAQDLLQAEPVQKTAARKVFWFEKYKWFITSDNFLVVAGYDASSNEKVVKKYLRENDRYVHADIHGAPSAVVRRKENSEEPISELALDEASIFAASHSKAWSSGLGAINAYWVNASQVSKTPAAGEFLPKGAFMVRGKRNYFSKIELILALGEIEFEGVEILMCGPKSALESRTDRLVVLKPGTKKKTEVAKQLSRIFNQPIDSVMHLLPPGDIDIIEVVGIDS
jgi:predicted ribosome quality control (RQC) complex YloA/Tae2 family protein